MEQIIAQILNQYGLYGLMIAGFAFFMYRQGQQNLERNKSVERRFDEERERAAEMENRLLEEFARSIAEKQKDIDGLTTRQAEAIKQAKEDREAHLQLQREFDQAKGSADAQIADLQRLLKEATDMLAAEQKETAVLKVNNNRLIADNQSLLRKNSKLSQDKWELQGKVDDLESQIEALRVEVGALTTKVSERTSQAPQAPQPPEPTQATQPIVMEMGNHGAESNN